MGCCPSIIIGVAYKYRSRAKIRRLLFACMKPSTSCVISFGCDKRRSPQQSINTAKKRRLITSFTIHWNNFSGRKHLGYYYMKPELQTANYQDLRVGDSIQTSFVVCIRKVCLLAASTTAAAGWLIRAISRCGTLPFGAFG